MCWFYFCSYYIQKLASKLSTSLHYPRHKHSTKSVSVPETLQVAMLICSLCGSSYLYPQYSNGVVLLYFCTVPICMFCKIRLQAVAFPEHQFPLHTGLINIKSSSPFPHLCFPPHPFLLTLFSIDGLQTATVKK